MHGAIAIVTSFKFELTPDEDGEMGKELVVNYRIENVLGSKLTDDEMEELGDGVVDSILELRMPFAEVGTKVPGGTSDSSDVKSKPPPHGWGSGGVLPTSNAPQPT